MNVEDINGSIILTDIKDFNLAQTLECGQCFHFMRFDSNAEAVEPASPSDVISEYGVSAYGRLLHIRQERETFIFEDTSKEEFENIWVPFFDLKNDYGKIKSVISLSSPELSDSIKMNSGIRLLNQEFFETVMSFIISQNNRIPRIKQLVADISARWGNEYSCIGCDGKVHLMHTFPTLDQLSEVTAEDFFEMKTGFRASYLYDAVCCMTDGKIKEDNLRNADAAECERMLMEIKGVGPKVANCIMLFSLGKRNAFPVDVWMKRAMEKIYFAGENISKEKISEFAKEKFGDYGGYAQQYIFADARSSGK